MNRLVCSALSAPISSATARGRRPTFLQRRAVIFSYHFVWPPAFRGLGAREHNCDRANAYSSLSFPTSSHLSVAPVKISTDSFYPPPPPPFSHFFFSFSRENTEQFSPGNRRFPRNDLADLGDSFFRLWMRTNFWKSADYSQRESLQRYVSLQRTLFVQLRCYLWNIVKPCFLFHIFI